jgi:hypothetical protein
MTSNIDTVRAIGKGIRVSETAVAEIVASLPESFDSKARGAVAAAVHSWACGDSPVPAQRTGGKGGPRTDYGIGADALTSAVKRALATSSDAVVLRATLSGEGGGSVTIPTDHALYAELVKLISGDDSDE